MKTAVITHSKKVKAAVVLGKRPLIAVKPATITSTISRPNSTARTIGRQGLQPT